MISEFLSQLSFAFGVTGPIFVLVALGILLKNLRLIDLSFMNSASGLVFNIALPTMLFFGLANTDIGSVLNIKYLVFSLLATLASFVLLSLASAGLVKNRRDRGVFVQGAFRANLAIIGLAFVLNAYGEQGLALASVFISVITIAYNILSIYTLSASLNQTQFDLVKLLIDIARNPLIIGILLGIAANLTALQLPEFLTTAGEYISSLTLPLALICIGGSLSFAELKNSSTESWTAVFAKLILVPAMIVYPAYLLGFSKIELGVMFLMVASPTAAASYVMVNAMGGNSRLAANIIVISTLASLLTVSFGLAFLSQFDVL